MLTRASDSRLCPNQLDNLWRAGSDFNAQLLRTVRKPSRLPA